MLKLRKYKPNHKKGKKRYFDAYQNSGTIPGDLVVDGGLAKSRKQKANRATAPKRRKVGSY